MIKYAIFGFLIIATTIVIILLIYAILGIDIVALWQDEKKNKH